MLTAARNELLTRVGPGTPMGDLLRRYWHPIGGASELEKNPVKPIRLMGENLVLYKDLSGTFGLVDRHCPHRRADMSYGWVEASGIRCSYHGWRYDETGACIDQPYEDTTNPEAVEVRLRDQGLSGARGRGPAVGLHGPEARARAAGVGAVQLAERLPRDRAGRRAVQLVPGPGELHRPGALRMDARQLVEPDEGRATRTRPSISSSSSRSSSTASPTSACAKGQSEEDSYWTIGRVALWPNGFYLGRHFEWRVPVDDENTLSVAWFFVRVPKGREPYVQNSVPTWKSPIQRRGRPLDHQPRHQPGHRRLGRAGHDRRPHAGASALKRHRHHHDAQPLLRGDRRRSRPAASRRA